MDSGTTSTYFNICQFVLNVTLAIYVHRVGMRNNDVKCSHTGRMKFLDMFFAFRHPIYREVEYNELRQMALYPTDVASLRKVNSTFTKSDSDLCNHQGGDFKLEEKVKMVKELSPKGKIDKGMWQRVARGIDETDKVIQHGKDLLKMQQHDSNRVTPIETEIVKWRAYLRNSSYLKCSTKFISNINGRCLNPDLYDFTNALREKRETYWELARDTELQNIRYENLKLLGDDEEITPYIP